MKKLLATLFLLSTLLGVQAQKKCSIETQALLQNAAKSASGKVELPRLLQQEYPLNADGTRVRILAKVAKNFDMSKLEKQGIVMGSRIADIVTLDVPVNCLQALEDCNEVLFYSIAHTMAPTCDATRFDTKTDSVQAGLGLPQPFMGDSIIIGITDWGFDYTHINYNNKGNTNHRLMRAWDQFRLAGPAPEGFNYGTEIVGHEDLLQAQCDTFGLYGYATHGTHVAGICAGRGVKNQYVGQAPNASLLFASFLLNEAAWLDAVAWMKQVAQQEQKRLVINNSWGMYTFSTLDGTSLVSQAIDAYSDQGIVFVTSGGNNGDDDFHVSKTFRNDTIDTLRTIAGYYPSGIGEALIMWGEVGKSFSAQIAIENEGTLTYSEMYNTANGDRYEEETLIVGGDTIVYDVMVEQANILSGRPHILFNVSRSDHNLHLFATATEGTVHAWNVCNLENHAGNMGAEFGSHYKAGYLDGDNYYGVGEPACSNKAIAVAAHRADRVRYIDSLFIPGPIASFSSWGPLINGVRKPEISAPGMNVVSSINTFTTDTYSATASADYGEYRYIWSKMSGTSMSGPAVTGIVALLLQANPDLSADAVREILFSTARNDEETGALRANDSISDRWGYGKADAMKAINEALARVPIDQATESRIPLMAYPNPAHDRLTVMTGRDELLPLQVFSIDGRLVLQQQVSKECVIDMQQWHQGIYLLKVGGRTAKVIKK